MSGNNCLSYRRDPRADGMPRGCISCRFCDSFGRCRASGRYDETGDARSRTKAARDLETDDDVCRDFKRS